MLRRLLLLVWPYWRQLALAGICLLISNAAALILPYLLRLLIDQVFVHHDRQALNRLALLLVVVVAVSSIFSFGRTYLTAYAQRGVTVDLRVAAYSHLQRLAVAFYDARRVGEIMSRLTNDIALVQSIVTDSIFSLAQQAVTIVGACVLVAVTDWRLVPVILALAPVLAVSTKLVGRMARQRSQYIQEQLAEANIILEETLSTPRVVRAFGREEYEVARYSAAILRVFTATLSLTRMRGLFGALLGTASMGATALVFWLGGDEVLASRLTAGGLISIVSYLSMLVLSLQALASLYTSVQQALGGAIRVFELLDTAPEIVDAPNAYSLPPVRGRLEVRDVYFSYSVSGPPVLCGVSLEAEPGQVVALVGPSGAGKTTLASLLLRFYVPQAGRILLDGHDVGSVTERSLRAAMAIVPQEPVLFGGTIYENIAYGRSGATSAEVEAAARAANAHAFIMALPRGYESVVGERGIKLSGGQRQRIAIARALLKDPRLLILDEATSSLDNESEGLVQAALERLMAGRTTLVIAHRLTTVERADKIVVLDRGRIVEQGSHAELLRNSSLYYRLYTRYFAGRRSGALHGGAPRD